MTDSDRDLRERLLATDAARPLPACQRWQASDLDRLLHRRRARQFVQTGLLCTAIASAVLWLGGRPCSSPADAARRSDPLPRAMAAFAAQELDAAMRRAQFRIERTAMASLCFAEALADLDAPASQRHQAEVARLFPDTAAARCNIDRIPGEQR